jgi:hypothetical protein
MRTGELQRALRLGPRLVKPASAQIGFAQPDIKGRVRGIHLGPEEVFSIGSTTWNSCPPSIIFVQQRIEGSAPSLVSPARQPGYRPGIDEAPRMASGHASRPGSSG